MASEHVLQAEPPAAASVSSVPLSRAPLGEGRGAERVLEALAPGVLKARLLAVELALQLRVAVDDGLRCGRGRQRQAEASGGRIRQDTGYGRIQDTAALRGHGERTAGVLES